MKFDFFHDLNNDIIGVDEVGKGSWSGPVVACSVLLDKKILNTEIFCKINDSKQLNKKQRIHFSKVIKTNSVYGFGVISSEIIDEVGIKKATELAMKISLKKFSNVNNKIRIDGKKFFSLEKEHEFLIKGDQKSVSIASASILAKDYRDKIMELLSKRFLGYDWEHNSGYGTPKHIAGLKKLGVCSEHRKSYKPIKKLLNG